MKKQVFGLLFFAALIVSMGFASASIWGDLKQGHLSDAFNNLKVVSNGINTEWSAQVLFFFLVLIVVFAVSNYLPFFSEKSFLSFAFSLIVSILAVFYLGTTEIYTILGSYKALGVVITAIVPFFVIAAISKSAHEKGSPFLAKLLWIAFIVALLGIIWFSETKDGLLGNVGYPLVLVLSVVMFFIEKWVYFKMFKANLSGDVDKSKKLLAASLTAKIEKIDDQLDSASPDVAKVLEARKKDLEDQLAKLK